MQRYKQIRKYVPFLLFFLIFSVFVNSLFKIIYNQNTYLIPSKLISILIAYTMNFLADYTHV